MPTMDLHSFLREQGPIIDVRSPGEFAQGHIPGAVNVPLFSDQERAEIGTLYKQVHPGEALLRGLELFGPRMADYLRLLQKTSQGGRARVHCWRGGMRSQSVAQLLNTAGIRSCVLEGGYKRFRQWALAVFERRWNLIVLGGFTGSGKTEILHHLRKKGEQVIDLEGIARHRGSAFGAIPGVPQPSNEHFENEIAYQLASLAPDRPIWIEDESRLVGSCILPAPLFEQMQTAPLLVIDRPLEERLQTLLNDYALLDREQLRECTEKLRKRLGNERCDEVIKRGAAGDLRAAAPLVLQYYDKMYAKAITRRKHRRVHDNAPLSSSQWAEKILSISLSLTGGYAVSGTC